MMVSTNMIMNLPPDKYMFLLRGLYSILLMILQDMASLAMD